MSTYGSEPSYEDKGPPPFYPKKPVMAIFVHAGAGYHSTQNENLHLAVCRDACNIAMTILKVGGTAVEAAAAAVASLEDSELTNAGFGSNLTMEGRVEADATVVDHLGRSGACGAVPHVKNPVLLAKMIMETSQIPLSLRRVPPNLLVGKGAASFAYTHGMPLLRNELLVSQGSRERFIRWRRELQRAAYMVKLKLEENNESLSIVDAHYHSLPITMPQSAPYQIPSPVEQEHSTPPTTKPRLFCPPKKRERTVPVRDSESPGPASRPSSKTEHGVPISTQSPRSPSSQLSSKRHCSGTDRAPSDTHIHMEDSVSSMKEDDIVDTVGAIAIDCLGNIAAAASSGGIGMKHRGRVGPAALVGVGAAVIPKHTNDEDGTSIATITSGTGEHMSTTLASQKCAERMYQGTRQNEQGRDVAEDDEDCIMESFIKQDFMNHPGVLYSPAPAAIGILAVKQTNNGVYFYFSHNTDSFAIASMAGDDEEPLCVMSRRRAKSLNLVARGARRVKA
ncbi:hypothetical protein Cpir12675_002633 [Ceratocystis pirilliformis]|uniref:Threonine aspartase 1 n=1 Tax=Ceratocystis pirilliformis TaxID=259994 RepID=A0ABR3Z9M0_9PEZI